MLGIAVKAVTHGDSLYPVGAILGAPEFTDAQLTTLLQIGHARKIESPDARLLLVAVRDVTTSDSLIKAGTVIADDVLSDSARAALLNCGDVAWVPTEEYDAQRSRQGYRATRAVTHDRIYVAGESLTVGAFTHTQLDLLVRIGYAERVPVSDGVSVKPSASRKTKQSRRR